jgi:hypothetical protein
MELWRSAEVVVVRDEDVVCEEFVTFFDEFTIFSVFLTISRVGLSALLSQVMSVWVSTECSEEGHDGYTCEHAHKCANCEESHMASSKDCQFFIKENKIQTIKVERNISYPEARKFVSVTNDSSFLMNLQFFLYS